MGLGGNHLVLALHEPARKVTRHDMPQAQVPLQGAEDRDTRANEHGDPRDYNAIDEASPQKAVNSLAAIDIGMVDVAGRKFGKNVLG